MLKPKAKQPKKPASQSWEDLSEAIDVDGIIAELTGIVGASDASRILDWLKMDTASRPEDVAMTCDAEGKETRTRFHTVIRERFRGIMSSRVEYRSVGEAAPVASPEALAGVGSTAPEGETADTNVKASIPKEARRRYLVLSTTKDKHQVGKWGPQWPAGRPPWTEFTMFKVDHDTLHAVSAVRRVLRVGGVIAYAGTKDRRAATS